MRYFLEYDDNKRVVGWTVKNLKPKGFKLIEVEAVRFQDELKKVGIDYELEEEKINRNSQEILENAEYVTDIDFRLASIELGL